MCNELKKVLLKMEATDEPMTKRDMIQPLKAIGDDMEKQSSKIETLEKKVDNLQDTQYLILSMVQKINNKLDSEKIEEKAYIYDRASQIIHNKWFWIIIIALILLGGVGISHFIDKSSNIAEIAGAVK